MKKFYLTFYVYTALSTVAIYFYIHAIQTTTTARSLFDYIINEAFW